MVQSADKVAENRDKSDRSRVGGGGGKINFPRATHKTQNRYWMKFRTAHNEATGFKQPVEGNTKQIALRLAFSVFVPPQPITAGFLHFFGSAQDAASGCLAVAYRRGGGLGVQDPPPPPVRRGV
jgi:hypothetical protein